MFCLTRALRLTRVFMCVFPCRPVKRAVQRELETTLAKALLRGDFVEEDTILVEADEHGLLLRHGQKQQSAQQPALAASGRSGSSGTW